jgi:hypothetical protein
VPLREDATPQSKPYEKLVHNSVRANSEKKEKISALKSYQTAAVVASQATLQPAAKLMMAETHKLNMPKTQVRGSSELTKNAKMLTQKVQFSDIMSPATNVVVQRPQNSSSFQVNKSQRYEKTSTSLQKKHAMAQSRNSRSKLSKTSTYGAIMTTNGLRSSSNQRPSRSSKHGPVAKKQSNSQTTLKIDHSKTIGTATLRQYQQSAAALPSSTHRSHNQNSY